MNTAQQAPQPPQAPPDPDVVAAEFAAQQTHEHAFRLRDVARVAGHAAMLFVHSRNIRGAETSRQEAQRNHALGRYALGLALNSGESLDDLGVDHTTLTHRERGRVAKDTRRVSIQQADAKYASDKADIVRLANSGRQRLSKATRQGIARRVDAGQIQTSEKIPGTRILGAKTLGSLPAEVRAAVEPQIPVRPSVRRAEERATRAADRVGSKLNLGALQEEIDKQRARAQKHRTRAAERSHAATTLVNRRGPLKQTRP
ncbi:MAG TPA: hypothetical protein VLE99_00555 [Candidatus Saccharimonadales bacterium]|nr:hypothetical protein [Candidatus Saccharimonadales bacterium]